MERVVEVKINKKPALILAGLIVVEIGVMAILLYPRKVK